MWADPVALLSSLWHPTPVASLNEVILFRNPVIDKHNRLCADPIWGELSRTNHVSGNELDTHSASWSTYCPVFSWMLTFLCLTIPIIHNSLLPGIKPCRKWCVCTVGYHTRLPLRTNPAAVVENFRQYGCELFCYAMLIDFCRDVLSRNVWDMFLSVCFL